jgi:uncharacterized membrane protein required for colicin V production
MYLDIFILVIVGFALVRGCMNGFVKEIASAIGFLLGLFVAVTCYEQFGEYLKVDGSEVNMFTSIIAFFILWIIVPILFGLLANLLTKAIEFTGLSWVNRIFGGIVSVIKFVVLISCVLNIMTQLNILNNDRLKDSMLADKVMWVTTFAIDKVADQVKDVDIEVPDFAGAIFDGGKN